MSEAEAAMTAFLRAYIAGDRTARLALVDWLEEHGDARVEAVRAARVNWDAVAAELFAIRHPYWERQQHSRRRADLAFGHIQRQELNRLRWWIDCALVGSDVPEDVAAAVRRAHRAWLAELFPETANSLPAL